MIITILCLLLSLIFTVLGCFHFFWFFGGVWGLEKVIPTKQNDSNALSIPKLATLGVGLILVLFSLVYFVKSDIITIQNPNWIENYGFWFIPSIFILRAIGDFKYVGFFKKIKNTEFAKADSKIFAPLCLSIGIAGILIQLMTK